MDLAGRRPLVTGANRGLGAAFVTELLGRGADRVYAGARDTATVAPLVAQHGDRVVPVRLDVTAPDDIRRAAERHGDVDLLVSNAGQTCITPVLAASDEAPFRSVFEVNFFGPLALVRAFAPQLRTRRGGVLFVQSLAALVISRSSPVYSASKAAAMMLAMGVRSELAAAGVTVTNTFPGFIDTDMTTGVEIPKASPGSVAQRSLDGLQAGRASVFPDRMAELVEDAVRTDMDAVLADPQAVMTRLVAALRDDRRAGD